MTRVVLSSEFYFIKAADLQKLPSERDVAALKVRTDIPLVFLKTDGTASLIDVADKVKQASRDEFIKVKVAYHGYPFIVGLILCLIKPIKRHFYRMNNTIFTVRLQDIIEAKLPRGERNAENAYQWNNKRWQISKEEAQKRYTDLRQSLQKNGYDMKSPMFIMLNRKFGARDQLFQGHHRIGICQELGIKEVSILFWVAPATSEYFKRFM